MFSRTTGVASIIAASPTIVWALLASGADYPKWNSTIVELHGDIAARGRISLVSTLDPDRTFALRVKTFSPESQLAWGDAMGTRTFTLEPIGAGATHFTMVERIGGPLFPLFAQRIPSFDESFERFCSDLKATAERRADPAPMQ